MSFDYGLCGYDIPPAAKDLNDYNSELCRFNPKDMKGINELAVQDLYSGSILKPIESDTNLQQLKKQESKWVSFHDEDTILLIKTEVDHTKTAHITETLTIDRKTGELK